MSGFALPRPAGRPAAGAHEMLVIQACVGHALIAVSVTVVSIFTEVGANVGVLPAGLISEQVTPP